LPKNPQNNSKENRLQRLKALAGEPEEQAAYARSLLETEKEKQVLEAALRVLQDFPDPQNRAPLLGLYDRLSQNGPKLDPGMYLRAAVLRALRPVARHADLPLVEQAALTYEPMPSRHDAEGAELRALALSLLNDLDDRLACFYAVKLLVDRATSEMSGEPALTAARILAAQNIALPLYQYLVGTNDKAPEVVAACLRGLESLPGTLLAKLVATYRFNGSEIVLLGLFDLLLTHPQGQQFSEVFTGFLAATGSFELYRYVALALITGGKPDLLVGLLESVKTEKDPLKREIVLELLPLIQGNDLKARAAEVVQKYKEKNRYKN
jgi:hypothetical protein